MDGVRAAGVLPRGTPSLSGVRPVCRFIRNVPRRKAGGSTGPCRHVLSARSGARTPRVSRCRATLMRVGFPEHSHPPEHERGPWQVERPRAHGDTRRFASGADEAAFSRRWCHHLTGHEGNGKGRDEEEVSVPASPHATSPPVGGTGRPASPHGPPAAPCPPRGLAALTAPPPRQGRASKHADAERALTCTAPTRLRASRRLSDPGGWTLGHPALSRRSHTSKKNIKHNQQRRQPEPRACTHTPGASPLRWTAPPRKDGR